MKGMNILSILKDQRAERLLCLYVVLPCIFFFSVTFLDLPTWKALSLKYSCIRMCAGEGAAAPCGVPCSSRDTQSQGCCSWRRSSSELLPHTWWCRYCSCKTGQEMEMCCITALKTLVWVNTDNFLTHYVPCLVLLSYVYFLVLVSAVSLSNETWDFWL